MLKQQLAHLFPSSSSNSCESSRTVFWGGGGGGGGVGTGGGGEGSYTQTLPEDVEATFALSQGLQVAEIDKGTPLLNYVHLTFGPYISYLLLLKRLLPPCCRRLRWIFCYFHVGTSERLSINTCPVYRMQTP
jgi:hypothetical protein